VIGLMARRVADVQDAMALLARPDAADPQSPPLWPAATNAFDTTETSRPKRIALSPRLGLGFAVDPDIADALRAAAAALTKAGHIVEDVDPDWPQGTSEEALMPLQLAGLAAIYGDRFKAGAWQADPGIASQIEAGLALSGRAVAESLELRKAMFRALHALHLRYDVLMTPTTAATAWPLDQMGPDRIEGRPATPRAHAVFTPIFNHCFGPACSVPFGLDRLGLPIGVQISGPMFADARLLSLAATIEAASPHDFSMPKRG
jgi:aspartyl-tRNA(Asn)/glutamyl-tRNA(Gln) amidotransferase subunit A